MILKLFRPSSPAHSISDLYGAIVAQAREPAFYSAYGAPDTVQGRFDLIVLHLVLVIAQIGREAGEQALPQALPQTLPQALPNEGAARAIGQQLFDTFCRDLDDNLREMGVGDLAVPKKMRSFAEAFYGRQAAYLAALAAADEQELEKALTRNIFQGSDIDPGAVRLARYARAALRPFWAQDDGVLLRGEVVFPKP